MAQYLTFWSSNYPRFCTGFFSTVAVVVVEKVASELSLWTKEEIRVGENDAEKMKNEKWTLFGITIFGGKIYVKNWNHTGMLHTH